VKRGQGKAEEKGASIRRRLSSFIQKGDCPEAGEACRKRRINDATDPETSLRGRCLGPRSRFTYAPSGLTKNRGTEKGESLGGGTRAINSKWKNKLGLSSTSENGKGIQA